MNVDELKRAAEAQLARIKDKKIWGRAMAVVEKLGRVQRGTCSGCYFTDYFFEEQLGRVRLKIIKEHSGMFGHLDTLKIFMNDDVVFDAEQVDFSEKNNPLRLLEVGDRMATVKIYKQGIWENFLDVERIQRMRVDRKRRYNLRKQEDDAHRERTRPLTSEELKLAKDLGIKID